MREKSKKNKTIKSSDYMHTFHLIVIFVFIFFIICYIIFAYVPEQLNCSLPTGGYDWLSFVGELTGVLIASWGVITTIRNNQEVAMQQAVLAVRPFLNIAIFNGYSLQIPCNLQGIYLPYSVENGEMKITGNFLFLNNMSQNIRNDAQQCLLQLRNIGLGAAMNIRIKILKIQKVAGETPSKCVEEDVGKFYKSIELKKNPTKCNTGYITSDTYYEIPPFHLNNSMDSFNIVMGQETFSGPTGGYYILEIVYQDAYENTNYIQYQHLRIEDRMCMYCSISAQEIIT